MAEDARGLSRFRLPWMSAQHVAPREPAPAPFEWRQTMKSRLLICASLLVAWTAAIEARLFYLQVIAHGEMTTRANNQHLRTIKTPAKRGDILDRNGRVLAFSVDVDTIIADPSEVEHPEETARALCKALDDCDAEKLRDITGRLKRQSQFAYLERQVSPEAGKRVRELDLQGIMLNKESRRYYPNRELAAHVLGYVGFDNKGLAGLESAYDARVRGQDGRLLVHIDSKKRARDAREERAATAGDTVETTIDQYLQHIAERELRAGVAEFNAAGGTAVIMQPQTGEILALANWPTFNPNAFRVTDEVARRNRATQDTYEPGSTFKLVTASAAFEEGVIDPTDLIDCAPGYITIPGRKPIHDVHPYGVLSFEDVIVKSSNVGAIKAGLKIGPERLSRYINRFGFGQTLSPDFRGESAGIVWNLARRGESSLASVSMGYEIGVTPLQMVTAVSSVANGGTLIEPRIVRAFIRGGRREPVQHKPVRRTVSPETAAVMTQIMESVVERGTATAAKVEGFTVAGKTGTAAKLVNGRYSDRDYNVSFVGFVPSRKPVLAVIVMIDSPHGKVTAYGGTVAAPIFKRIAEASLRHLGVAPTINAPSPVMIVRDQAPRKPAMILERVAVREGVVPDVRGLSAREAVRELMRVGLSPRIDGSGLVIEQSPEAGTTVIPGDQAVLTLRRRLPPLPTGGAQQ